MATKKFKAFTLDDEAKVLRFHYLFKKKMRTKPGFFLQKSALSFEKKSNFQGFFLRERVVNMYFMILRVVCKKRDF